MKEFKAAVINDLQCPYHDPDAVDVAAQIIRDHKVDVLDLNGDIFDFFNLSAHPNVKTDINEHTAVEFQGELDRGFKLVSDLVEETKPNRVHWKNGNHEFRLLRAIANADIATKKILELKVVRNAYSYPSLFRFDELPVPVVFAGEYPKGLWIHPDLPPDKNVWVEHGYVARKKSGFTASALLEERMSSAICGHCERLAYLWRHVNGDRNFFAIENGNLSMLGVPGVGDGVYFGVPLSEPDYRNSQQGLTLLTYTGGEWFPEVIRIVRGKAFHNGKLYESRVTKRTHKKK